MASDSSELSDASRVNPCTPDSLACAVHLRLSIPLHRFFCLQFLHSHMFHHEYLDDMLTEPFFFPLAQCQRSRDLSL